MRTYALDSTVVAEDDTIEIPLNARFICISGSLTNDNIYVHYTWNTSGPAKRRIQLCILNNGHVWDCRDKIQPGQFIDMVVTDHRYFIFSDDAFFHEYRA